jgi:hypothetical protein
MRVDFGKRLPPAGSRRSFHLEHIAFQRSHIPIVLHRAHTLHQLSSRLPGFAERQGLAALAVTGFLGKLALGGAEGCFALCDQALGDRPRSHLVAPKGAAGMTQQNFNAVAVVPVEEKASALPTRVGSSY